MNERTSLASNFLEGLVVRSSVLDSMSRVWNCSKMMILFQLAGSRTILIMTLRITLIQAMIEERCLTKARWFFDTSDYIYFDMIEPIDVKKNGVLLYDLGEKLDSTSKDVCFFLFRDKKVSNGLFSVFSELFKMDKEKYLYSE